MGSYLTAASSKIKKDPRRVSSFTFHPSQNIKQFSTYSIISIRHEIKILKIYFPSFSLTMTFSSIGRMIIRKFKSREKKKDIKTKQKRFFIAFEGLSNRKAINMPDRAFDY